MEIAIVMVVGSVEDEKTLSLVNFTKSKLCNCLTTHLDLVVQMYAQKFYKSETFNSQGMGKKEVAFWRIVNTARDMALVVFLVLWLHYQVQKIWFFYHIL